MSNSKHILIADDDQQLVDALARRCRSLGLFATPAYDGESALQQINETIPDLVMLDINIPRGNGLAVSDKIRRDPDLHAIPIIMLTDRKDSHTIQICHEHLRYYVPKGPHVWLHLEPLIGVLLEIDDPQQIPSLLSEEAGTRVSTFCNSAKP